MELKTPYKKPIYKKPIYKKTIYKNCQFKENKTKCSNLLNIIRKMCYRIINTFRINKIES